MATAARACSEAGGLLGAALASKESFCIWSAARSWNRVSTSARASRSFASSSGMVSSLVRLSCLFLRSIRSSSSLSC
eukprot:2002113-Alexandrium_andersonii.AAC.1